MSKKRLGGQVFPRIEKGPILLRPTSQRKPPSLRFRKISLAGRAPQLQLTFAYRTAPSTRTCFLVSRSIFGALAEQTNQSPWRCFRPHSFFFHSSLGKRAQPAKVVKMPRVVCGGVREANHGRDPLPRLAA